MRASVSSTGVHATMCWWKVHGLQEVVLVQVSCGNQLEIRAKKGRILNYTAKRNSWRNETAMDNLQAWKMAAKSWSLLPFAFHVNAMLNLSSPWPDVRPVFFDPFLKTCFVEQCFFNDYFLTTFYNTLSDTFSICRDKASKKRKQQHGAGS